MSPLSYYMLGATFGEEEDHSDNLGENLRTLDFYIALFFQFSYLEHFKARKARSSQGLIWAVLLAFHVFTYTIFLSLVPGSVFSVQNVICLLMVVSFYLTVKETDKAEGKIEIPRNMLPMQR